MKPVINLLKKIVRFRLDDNCDDVFKELKNFLASPPVIQKPLLGQPIMVYLSVSREAVSSVLVQEVNGEQWPIYFISRTLQEPEMRYQMTEKITLALITAARRMRHTFRTIQM